MAIVTFGPFEVNLQTGELRKRGIGLSLQDQPLRILTALLERPGEVVTRVELCRRLWPHGTYVDFEHSLNAAVRRLRVTLGDTAETPRFIETVHRRGYKFLMCGPLPVPKPAPPADDILAQIAVLVDALAVQSDAARDIARAVRSVINELRSPLSREAAS